YTVMDVFCTYFFFFFSSRRRHTISKRDWSSDVCSSDLIKGLLINFIHHFWPSLLKLNFLEEFITPIVKVTKKSDSTRVKPFYSKIGRASCRERVKTWMYDEEENKKKNIRA